MCCVCFSYVRQPLIQDRSLPCLVTTIPSSGLSSLPFSNLFMVTEHPWKLWCVWWDFICFSLKLLCVMRCLIVIAVLLGLRLYGCIPFLCGGGYGDGYYSNCLLHGLWRAQWHPNICTSIACWNTDSARWASRCSGCRPTHPKCSKGWWRYLLLEELDGKKLKQNLS